MLPEQRELHSDLAFLRTWPLAFDILIATLFGTMTRSRSEKVICICRKCHPGKKVALRTRQEHYQSNGQPKIAKALSGRSISYRILVQMGVDTAILRWKMIVLMKRREMISQVFI